MGYMMNNKKLQEYFELNDNDNDKLVDVKLSVGNVTSAPSEIIDQVKDIIKADQDGMLKDFVDF